MKYILILLLSIFLTGCNDLDGRVIVDCKKKEVVQLEWRIGGLYAIHILPLTVDSSCNIKENVETYLNKGK